MKALKPDGLAILGERSPALRSVQGVGVLDRWLLRGDVRPRVSWLGGKEPTIAIAPGRAASPDGIGGLYGALAIQLAAEARAGQLSECSNPDCRALYRPTMKPRADRRHYCTSCSSPDDRSISWKLNQRDKRAGTAKPRKRPRRKKAARR